MTRVLCSGSFVCDLVAANLPQIAVPGELVYAPNGIQLNVGGHSANVSIDLVQLGQGDIAAAGCVGEDALGDYLEGELGRSGVKAYVERSRDAQTAKNIALVVEGEDRRFIAELAANALLSTRFVLYALEDTRPDIFFLGTVGGLMYIDEDLVEVLKNARNLGGLTVVDAIMPHGFGWGHLTQAMPLIDVLHCNELESSAMTGTSDPQAAATMLIEEGIRMVIITMGSDGLIAATENQKLCMPAFDVVAEDPTGAGDAFCAGFIDALIELSISKDQISQPTPEVFKRALLEGGAAGAACVSAVGATIGVTRELVKGLIEQQGEKIWMKSRTVEDDLY